MMPHDHSWRFSGRFPCCARSVLSRHRADVLAVRPSRLVNKIYILHIIKLDFLKLTWQPAGIEVLSCWFLPCYHKEATSRFAHLVDSLSTAIEPQLFHRVQSLKDALMAEFVMNTLSEPKFRDLHPRAKRRVSLAFSHGSGGYFIVLLLSRFPTLSLRCEQVHSNLLAPLFLCMRQTSNPKRHRSWTEHSRPDSPFRCS